MKKLIVYFLILAGCLHSTGYAQDYKHEFDIGYGIANTSTILNVFSNLIVSTVTAGTYSSNTSHIGSFHLSYKFLLNERVGLGGTYVYTNSTSDALYQEVPVGEFTNNYHTAALEMDYKYINNPKWVLYSTAGFGANFYVQRYAPIDGEAKTKTVVHPDFQLSLLGIKYGTSFGVFAEAGFGYKGIISGGLFTRF